MIRPPCWLARSALGAWGLAALLVLLVPLSAHAAFNDSGDGTVSDSTTQLMWDQCAWGRSGAGCTGTDSDYTWGAALAVALSANSANHRGHNDWRLPNRNELASLTDVSRSSPAVDTTAFPNTGNNVYWTSTHLAADGLSAWSLEFSVGVLDQRPSSGTTPIRNTPGYNNTALVRLVRGGVPSAASDAFTPAADMAVSFSNPVGTALAGTPLGYTILVSNLGPDVASNATVTVALPSGTTFASLSAPSSWVCTTPTVGAGGSLSCNKTSLAAGNVVLGLVVAVKGSVAAGTVLLATATAANSVTDAVPGNNTATAQTTTASAPRAANAHLSALTLSSGTLSPAFAASSTGYTATVANSVTSLQLTPTLAVATASVKVNGTAAASGAPSSAVGLTVGPTPILVQVTAEDGTTVKTYTITVTRADAINDTGQTTCYDGTAMVACSTANSGDAATSPRQDGRFGRDAAAAGGLVAKTGAGAAGFDYTRVCMSGEPAGQGTCPASPAQGGGYNQWACTRDNVTQLVWSLESSVNDWATSTSVYAVAMNASARCGFNTGWRLPTRRELLSLVHLGASNPSIDGAYFSGTQSNDYWSSDSSAIDGASAWVVSFGDGRSNLNSKTISRFVRLVRSVP